MPLDRMRLYTENYQKAGGTRAFSDYYTAAYGGALFDRGWSTTSPSPTTAWPPTACSPRRISSAAAT
jgi:hypothetical protein